MNQYLLPLLILAALISCGDTTLQTKSPTLIETNKPLDKPQTLKPATITKEDIVAYLSTHNQVKSIEIPQEGANKIASLETVFGLRVDIYLDSVVNIIFPPEQSENYIVDKNLNLDVNLTNTSNLAEIMKYVNTAIVFDEALEFNKSINSPTKELTYSNQITKVSPNVDTIYDCGIKQNGLTTPINTTFRQFETSHSGNFGMWDVKPFINTKDLEKVGDETSGTFFCSVNLKNGSTLYNQNLGKIEASFQKYVSQSSDGSSSSGTSSPSGDRGSQSF